MISRRTANALGEAYSIGFTYWHRANNPTHKSDYRVKHEVFYDFLFDRDYEPWFCNKVRRLYGDVYANGRRKVKDFIMQLHTGETQIDATKNWNWEQRKALGQRYLRNLAEDILRHGDDVTTRRASRDDLYDADDFLQSVATLRSSLELDGYVYRNSRLLSPESDVLDTEEAAGVLDELYTSLALDNKTLALHHLKLSEEHFLAKRWDDTISNARKFLETVLQEVASAYSKRVKGTELSEKMRTRPVEIRDYLEHEGLLEKKEKEALSSVYGLLSHTGGHPYMAQNDQARLLRQLALTLSQFVMLRLEGVLKTP